MRTSIKVGGYALGLAAIFAAAVGVGRTAGPDTTSAPPSHDTGLTTGNDETPAVAVPGGLQVAEDGYRLVPISTGVSTGVSAPLTFRVTGPDGTAVTDYTPTHDRNLHLIVVRRDLSGYQHVHPVMAGDGTWSVPMAVATAGQYRIFADFQPAARTESLTLGVDLPASGAYEPLPLPTPARTTTVDGYTVTLTGDLVAATTAKLTLTVSKGGAPVTDLQPYLAAYGHLVALRDGDLAYLHVHPDGGPGDGRTAAGPDITFYAEVPSAGAYRLFLDFQHAGTVRTAAFTAVAVDAGSTTTATPAPAGDDPDSGHGQESDPGADHR